MAEICAQSSEVLVEQILSLNPATYQRHRIHGEGRIWAETNCYSDVIIELLHALGHEPVAGLAFTLAADFEGDQWTFFKFPYSDMVELFGLDIQELNPWRSLPHHIEEQLRLGRPVLVELDSFYLPDTQGTAYRLAHVKSTAAVVKIDIQNKLLGYFHNQSYHELSGQDFEEIFQLGGLAHPRILSPYIEYVKIRPKKLSAEQVLAISLTLLKKHLVEGPVRNPFFSFKEKFSSDLDWLMKEDIALFHSYSFATLRQYGACFELSETYLQWLKSQGEQGLDQAIAGFHKISENTKTFQFQLARAMARKKALELEPLNEMGKEWQNAILSLKSKYL